MVLLNKKKLIFTCKTALKNLDCCYKQSKTRNYYFGLLFLDNLTSNMKITIPLYKSYPTRKGYKKILFSLNNYLMPLKSNKTINTYYLEKAKADLMEEVTAAIQDVKPIENFPCDLLITIYRETDRQTDMGNYSVLEKFTTDAIVQAGIIPDDCYKYIRSVSFLDGGKDRSNPRAEYFLREQKLDNIEETK